MADRGARMSLTVKRVYHTLPLTPSACEAGEGWRVTLICTTCNVPKDLNLGIAHNHLSRWWTTDFADIFEKAGFRCTTCSTSAQALRITRPTRDANETLLVVSRSRS